MNRSVMFGKLNNKNIIHLPLKSGDFVITYIDSDTLILIPEENWSPDILINGVEIDNNIYNRLYDYICINSSIVHVNDGKLKLSSNLVKKIAIEDFALVIDSDFILISSKSKFCEEAYSLSKVMK